MGMRRLVTATDTTSDNSLRSHTWSLRAIGSLMCEMDIFQELRETA